jgi:tRNA modification GTPase
VTIAGPTNAGKSSIFNALVGFDRAIVSEVPGTTRDIVSESIDLNGVPVLLADTAGLRDEGDPLEREGMRRAESLSYGSDVVLVVLNSSVAPSPQTLERVRTFVSNPHVIALSKCDLPESWSPGDAGLGPVVRTSAHTGDGIATLRRALLSALLGADRSEEAPIVTNARHIDLLTRASAALARATSLARDRAPEEVLLLELTAARAAVEEVSGRRTPDDILAHIFGRFCIGK